MPLSWNEIRNRALAFARRWKDEDSERSAAQSFWNEFFEVFGLDRKRVAVYEKKVSVVRNGGDLKKGRIDLFWPGKLLVEQKSRGKDLDRAYGQAADYFDGLIERNLPRYILVSDFARFRLHDLTDNVEVDFRLEDLPKSIKHFGFMAGYSTRPVTPQDPVNIRAAELLGRLHDKLRESGYEGHPLEVLLVRLLFCLFAEDTGIFQPVDAFESWIEDRTSKDGTDLGPQLAQLFQVLNTPEAKRPKTLDEQLAAFPYVDGKLFEETLPIASFDSDMREALLDCNALDWSSISPAIFGALFQSIMDREARRNLGAHYTSEENIMKLIGPLFLDDLREEFERSRRSRNKLFDFHKKLRRLTFFDPACGCGNFLVIAYRELRELELEVLRASRNTGQRELDVHQLIAVDVDQFHGIELEEFPAQIAQVALWLTDHQLNLRVSEEFGMYFARIPLRTTPNIHCGNALTMDWNDVLPAERANFVFGNPPFVGAKYMSDSQRQETRQVFEGIKSGGLLDYVAAWYVKAVRYIHGANSYSPPESQENGKVPADIRCAFVSTNSITQGEQVGVLWSWMLGHRVKIHFAHRTFQWSNEARGVAAVHCVIVGFGTREVPRKTLFEYEDIRGEPLAVSVQNINPYLVNAPDVVIVRRSKPICTVPKIGIGNKPIDGGNYLFTTEERDEFIKREPKSEKFFRRWIGSDEFLNGYERWCLWLGDCPPDELRKMPHALARVEAVKRFRLASKSAPTKKLAQTPKRFHVENMPSGNYLVLPEVSSERRQYVPIGFESPETFCSNLVKVAPDAKLYHFGVLSSTMHNAWIRYVAGRLKSDFRYSSGIVYNNFPWPENVADAQRKKIEASVQAVLDARDKFPGSSLADLYDPRSMPSSLRKIHQQLDNAVDAAYGRKKFKNDAERVAFLFALYQKYTSLLPSTNPKRSRKGSPKARKKGTKKGT